MLRPSSKKPDSDVRCADHRRQRAGTGQQSTTAGSPIPWLRRATPGSAPRWQSASRWGFACKRRHDAGSTRRPCPCGHGRTRQLVRLLLVLEPAPTSSGPAPRPSSHCAARARRRRPPRSSRVPPFILRARQSLPLSPAARPSRARSHRPHRPPPAGSRRGRSPPLPAVHRTPARPVRGSPSEHRAATRRGARSRTARR
jgi:hypothetical protein